MNANEVDKTAVLRHVPDLVRSIFFCRAPSLCNFLRFIVEETLAGRGDLLKEYSIGTNVFRRSQNFDPKQDSIVRVEAVKLRARLAEYYRSLEAPATLRILLERGCYQPEFHVCRSFETSPDHDLVTQLVASADLATWRRTHHGIVVARRYLSRAIELDPSDARVYVGFAESYRSALDMEFESPAQLLPHFEKKLAVALNLAPENVAAHILRSNLLCAAQGDGPSALAAIDDVVRVHPSSARAHFWRSAVLSSIGNHSEAIRAVREATRLEPQTALFHVYSARILIYARQTEEATQKLEQLIEVDPGLPVAYLWFVLSLIEVGQFERAISSASSMLALGDNSLSRSCLSYAFAKAGHRSDALTSLEQLLKRSESSYVSPLWLAAISEALGGSQEAHNEIGAAIAERAYPLMWLRSDPRFTHGY